MTEYEKYEITRNEEYKAYIAALCRLASGYVSRIRREFAEKAFEKFNDPTIRRLVLEYGKECEKLDEQRLRDFTMAANDPSLLAHGLEDSCLNNARHYGEAIKLFFLER